MITPTLAAPIAGGTIHPVRTDRDAEAVIGWLNGRAKGYTEPFGGEEVNAFWCTGKVGMTGTSYNGTLPIAAATTGVDGLEAVTGAVGGTVIDDHEFTDMG